MKVVVKGLAILCFFSIMLGSCFDPPQFPSVPEIVFQKVKFCDVNNNSLPDSIIISLNFKDGDGDLGLDTQNPLYSSSPFNYANFFQTNSNGELLPITTTAGQLKQPSGEITLIDVLDIADPAKGNLVFARTRKNPLYSNLPVYSCVDYEYREFIIDERDKIVLGDSPKNIVDTIKTADANYLLVKDTLYIQSNPNHYNIEIDFLVETSSGFVHYDFRKEFCTTFDGRFPILTEKNSALDGTLTYAMESRGFLILFGGKTLKLRIQVKDQALHLSNIIETPPFTLASVSSCK